MGARVKAAAVDGLIVGVKWGVTLLVITVLQSWWAGDYALVRSAARNGQIAFNTLQQMAQQQAAAQKARMP